MAWPNMMEDHCWCGDEIAIIVSFRSDPAGTVFSKDCDQPAMPRPGLLERARFRLNRLQARLFP